MDGTSIKVGLIVGSKIAEYFGLINGVSTEVTKLVHQAFKSAKDHLEFARNSSGEIQIDYIKQARNKFIDAINVEENENKVMSLVGLSMCQYLLNESNNARQTIERIKDVELTSAEKMKAIGKDVGSYVLWPSFRLLSVFLNPEERSNLQNRKKQFEDTKQQAIISACQILRE